MIHNIFESKGGIYTLDFDKFGEILAFSGTCSKVLIILLLKKLIMQIRMFDVIKGEDRGEFTNKEALNRIYSIKFCEDPNCFVTGGWLKINNIIP